MSESVAVESKAIKKDHPNELGDFFLNENVSHYTLLIPQKPLQVERYWCCADLSPGKV